MILNQREQKEVQGDGESFLCLSTVKGTNTDIKSQTCSCRAHTCITKMYLVTCWTILYTFDQNRVPVWTLDVQIGIWSIWSTSYQYFPLATNVHHNFAKVPLSRGSSPILTGQRWLACQSGPGDIWGIISSEHWSSAIYVVGSCLYYNAQLCGPLPSLSSLLNTTVNIHGCQ